MTTAAAASTPVGTSEASAPSAGPPGRITSLDWVRGLMLCWSITSAAWLAPRPEPLQHAAWLGVHAEDMIFPLFVTLSGCGLAFAYRNRVGWAATLRRSLVLLVIGLLFPVIETGSADPATLKWTGPLQVYAVLVLVVGLLHLVAHGPATWAGITLATASAQAWFLHAWQQRCPGGALTPACNPSRTVDPLWLGTAHMYHHGTYGHDPEGAVAILGAFVVASVGVTAGHLMLRHRGNLRGPVATLGWAAVCLSAAVAAAQFLPAFKRLWTTPFALGVAALGVVALALGTALLDLPAGSCWQRLRTRAALPWVAMGRNSLLLYFGSHIVCEVLVLRGGDPSWATRFSETIAVAGHPRATFWAVMLLGWAGVAWLLHRRRIYLRP